LLFLANISHRKGTVEKVYVMAKALIQVHRRTPTCHPVSDTGSRMRLLSCTYAATFWMLDQVQFVKTESGEDGHDNSYILLPKNMRFPINGAFSTSRKRWDTYFKPYDF
jgi:hypothetical protein